MLNELHELLGLVAAGSVSAAVVLGASAYRYQRVKGFLPVKRPTLVTVHLWLAVAFVAAMTFHYLIARHVHWAQQAGALTLVLALLLGLTFRLSRKHFQVAIKVKIALVIIAAILLPIGHWLVEGEGPEDRESRLNSASPVVGQVASPASLSANLLS